MMRGDEARSEGMEQKEGLPEELGEGGGKAEIWKLRRETRDDRNRKK